MLGFILIIVAAVLVILDMAANPPRFPLTQIAVLLVCIALLLGIHTLALH